MDEDLDQMTREPLIDEIKKLRQGIRRHRDSSRHELCWHHPALWGLLPERTDPVPVVPEWPEFMNGCVRYRQSLDEQAPDAPRTKEPYEENHWYKGGVLIHENTHYSFFYGSSHESVQGSRHG